MAVVTDIRPQRRQSGRFSIYLDKSYAFSLSDLDLANSGLRIGRELDEAEIETWRQCSLEGKAYDVAVRFLGYRARSTREVTDKLRQKEYSDEVIAWVVDRLVELHYLDDRVFAASWVANRKALKPRSRQVLEQELLQKGVSRDIAREAIAAVGDDGHDEMLSELIEKKRRQLRYQDDKHITAYLARQGFGYDQIKKALARLDD